MIPPLLETQIQQQMNDTRTAALLAQMFAGINQRTETEAKSREDSKLEKARLWWKEQER